MIRSNVKKYSVFVLFLIGILALNSVVFAQTDIADYVEVKVDGDEIYQGGVNDFDRDGTLDVRVIFDGDANFSRVQLEASISGYEYSRRSASTSDVTEPFEVKEGVTYRKDLELNLPQDLDSGRYTLRVRFTTPTGYTQELIYELDVDKEKDSLHIEDVIFSPSAVQAGRSTLATVRIENDGKQDQKGIKVSVSVPELDVADSRYIEEIESDDETSSEELILRVPRCAEAGDYVANVEVEYDEGHERVTEQRTIRVLEGDLCPTSSTEATGTDAAVSSGKTLVNVGVETQEVKVGEGGAIYPLTMTNTGTAAKTFTITADANPGLDVTVNPSNVVVLAGGSSQTVYVYVSATETASAGEQLVAVSLRSGDELLKQVSLKAVVSGESKDIGWEKVKRGLEIGLVVLVVLLVILGLIIGFNKLKGDEDEEAPESGQTYY